MRAVVVREAGRVAVEEVAEPEVRPDQLLVKAKACSICSATDRDIIDGFWESYTKIPCILGHESVGKVVEVGTEVEGFEVGDRILAYPPWGSDKPRPDGLYLCTGQMADYFTSNPLRALKLPASLAPEDAALAVQVGECIHGVRIAQIEPTDKVVILGQGSIGLFFTQLVREEYAEKIIAVDLLEPRLKISRHLGVDLTIDATETDPIEEVRSATNGIGADVVIYATGSLEAFRQSFKMIRPGGKILVFGHPTKPLDNFDLNEIILQELKVLGVLGCGLTHASAMEHVRIAVRLISEKRLQTKPIITHVLPLSKAEYGFECIRNKSAIKVVLKP